MSELNLHKALAAIDINADWVGLREVKETTTYRVIRDGNPQANSRNTEHGVMVEVLADGQFGYYGCNSLNHINIQNAAEKALEQAKAAAKIPYLHFQVMPGLLQQADSNPPLKNLLKRCLPVDSMKLC